MSCPGKLLLSRLSLLGCIPDSLGEGDASAVVGGSGSVRGRVEAQFSGHTQITVCWPLLAHSFIWFLWSRLFFPLYSVYHFLYTHSPTDSITQLCNFTRTPETR